MSKSSTDPSQTQEIDLLELFVRMGNGIKRSVIALAKLVLFLIVFGIKKIHFLLVFGAIGCVTGFILFSSTQRYYSSDLIAQPNGISSSDMINYINDLHILCAKNNTEALAFALQMPDTTARKIKNIQAYFIVDVNNDGIGDYIDYKNTFNLKDTSQSQLFDRVLITVEVYNNTVFDNVRNGIFTYIRKNPYLIKLNEIRKQELEELIEQTNYEIGKLDSLQDVEYFEKGRRKTMGESQMMIFSEKELGLYYKDKLSLLNRKQIYQKELDLSSDAFTIIKDFTSLAVAENPKGKYVIRYAVILSLLGYLALLLFEYRKKIFEFVN